MKNQRVAWSEERMLWMDLLRGAAIILVALNHGILFATINGNSTPAWLISLNDKISPVRMPLMVFLSGMLLPRSLAKGKRQYLDGKVRSIVYPYVVWSIIILIIDSALKYYRGGTFISPVAFLYAPYAHLWFLYYLFLFYLIALVLSKVPAPVIAGASLIVAFLIPEGYQRFFVLLMFFILGRISAERIASLQSLMSKTSTGIVCGLVGLLLVPLAIAGEPVRYQPLFSPVVISAVLFFVWVSIRAQSAFGMFALRYIGRNSLIFYIIHWYPMLFGVEIGLAVGMDHGWIPVSLGTVAGIGAGYMACWFIASWPALNLFFTLSKRPKMTTARRSTGAFKVN